MCTGPGAPKMGRGWKDSHGMIGGSWNHGEEIVLGAWGRGTCCTVAELLARLLPADTWNMENVRNELTGLAREFSKPNVEETAKGLPS